jgi:hypothetical protein
MAEKLVQLPESIGKPQTVMFKGQTFYILRFAEGNGPDLEQSKEMAGKMGKEMLTSVDAERTGGVFLLKIGGEGWTFVRNQEVESQGSASRFTGNKVLDAKPSSHAKLLILKEPGTEVAAPQASQATAPQTEKTAPSQADPYMASFERALHGDRELAEVVSKAIESLGNNNIVMLFGAYSGYDKADQYEGRPHHAVKEYAKLVPEYAKAAESVGLSKEQATDLAIQMLDCRSVKEPYAQELRFMDVVYTYSDLSFLTVAFKQIGMQGGKVSDQELAVLKGMMLVAFEYDVTEFVFDTYKISRQIGLTLEQAKPMMMHLIDSDYYMSSDLLIPFNHALNSLSVAKVPPELVPKAFAVLAGDRTHYKQGAYWKSSWIDAYKMFENVVTFVCPSMGLSPKDLLESIVACKSSEDADKLLQNYLKGESAHKLIGEEGVSVIIPNEQKKKYFTPVEGPLSFAALPYRTKRSLEDGIEDLARLMKADYTKGETVAEGAWVFDRYSSTWYSLGGKTEIAGNAVRTSFVNYDISSLSPEPMLFHVHPEKFEFLLEPPKGISQKERIIKFLAATPSRMDYSTVATLMKSELVGDFHPRSFIVNSSGITEYTYPNDIPKIEEMGKNSQAIRDEALLNFDYSSVPTSKAGEGKILVNRLIEQLNEQLPPDFEIRMFGIDDASKLLEHP